MTEIKMFHQYTVGILYITLVDDKKVYNLLLIFILKIQDFMWRILISIFESLKVFFIFKLVSLVYSVQTM